MNFGTCAAITALILAVAAPSLCDATAAPARVIAATHPRASNVSRRSANDTAKLLGLSEEWVKTWNEKDVNRMQQLQGDDLLYGAFGSFTNGRALLKQLRDTNFWGLTYTLRTIDPQVRILSKDSALVWFKLVGKSAGPRGSQPYSSLFTLVYQRRGDEWKIVHVHDSDSGPAD